MKTGNPNSISDSVLRWLAAIGLMLVVGHPLPAAAAIESKIEKSFNVEPGGQLVVDSDRGSVEVRVGGPNEVFVSVTREVTDATAAKAEAIFAAHEVTLNQSGGTVLVRGKLQKEVQNWLGRGPNLQVRYVITVPPKFNLDLRTAAGSITCGDIQGTVKARTAGGSLKFGKIVGPFDGSTSAGSIHLGGVTGKVQANTAGGSIDLGEAEGDAILATSAGSITVKSVKGKLEAKTAGGSIKAGELAGPAELTTSAGSIRVESAQGKLLARTAGGSITLDEVKSAVSASTSAGSITATFTAQPEGDCQLKTSGGKIQVKLDAELAFDVDAQASGGRVTTELPIVTTVVGEHKTSGLKGKLNGGGKTLELKSTAGDIAILKR